MDGLGWVVGIIAVILIILIIVYWSDIIDFIEDLFTFLLYTLSISGAVILIGYGIYNRSKNQKRESVRQAFIEKYHAEYMIIDTNILMDLNKKYNVLFNQILPYIFGSGYRPGKIWIAQKVYYELLKHKEAGDAREQAGARHALNRISYLQSEKVLDVDILDYDSFDVQRNLPKDTYADPEIFNNLYHMAMQGSSVGLITNDRALRITSSTLLARIPNCPKVVIIDSIELIKEYRIVKRES